MSADAKSTGKFRDFDAFRREAAEENPPPRFRLFGQEWEMPPSLPFGLMLRASYLEEAFDEDDDVPFEALKEIIEAVFGREVLDEWISRGIDVNTVEEIVLWVSEAYSISDDEESELGEEAGTE